MCRRRLKKRGEGGTRVWKCRHASVLQSSFPVVPSVAVAGATFVAQRFGPAGGETSGFVQREVAGQAFNPIHRQHRPIAGGAGVSCCGCRNWDYHICRGATATMRCPAGAGVSPTAAPAMTRSSVWSDSVVDSGAGDDSIRAWSGSVVYGGSGQRSDRCLVG